jgi:hypothetical protein
MRNISVTKPAATTGLTTVDAVKFELGISDASEDDYLSAQINRASSLICTYLGVAVADDATMTLGRETLLETIRPEKYDQTLILSRRPIVSIASVTEESDAVDAADYLIGYNTGILSRLNNGFPALWLGKWSAFADQSISIAYTAGWLLPGDTGRNLPFEIEDVAISIVKASRFGRMRDPLIRSISTSIPEIEDKRVDYQVGGLPGVGNSWLSPENQLALKRFMKVAVG